MKLLLEGGGCNFWGQMVNKVGRKKKKRKGKVVDIIRILARLSRWKWRVRKVRTCVKILAPFLYDGHCNVRAYMWECVCVYVENKV